MYNKLPYTSEQKRLLSVVVQVATKSLAPVDVVADVQLLVDGVGAIVASAHGQKKHLGAQLPLESQGDRNRAAFSGEVWLDVPHVLGGLGGGGEGLVERIRLPVLTVVDQLHLHLVLGVELLEDLGDMGEHQLIQFGRFNVRHRSDGELTRDFSRDHCFGTSARERSLDTVDGQGWVSPSVLQDILLVVVQSGLGARRSLQLIYREVNVVVQGILFFG